MIELLHELIYLLLFCAVAVSYIAASTAERLFGIGKYPVLSAAIGSVVAIVIMLINIELAVVAIIIGAVISVIAGLVQDKLL